MSNWHFITDLDRTIIHSKHPGYRCVEKNTEKPITYMTDYSYECLLELLKESWFNFIPCTMRNWTQVMRISFLKDHAPKYLICTNGAQIYIDGVLDLEWEARMRKVISKEELEADSKVILSLNLPPNEMRCTEDFYLTLKFKDDEQALVAFKKMQNQFNLTRQLIQMGRKVFLIHESIDKLHAVDYLIDKYRFEHILTAGDSEVDRRFTTNGEAFLPQHASFRHSNAFVSKQSGVSSTDEILNEIIRRRHLFEEK